MKTGEPKGRLSRLLFLLSRREKFVVLQLFLLMIGGAVLETVSVGAIPAFVALLSSPEMIVNRPVVIGFMDAFGLSVQGDRLVLWASVALVILFLFKNVYLASLTYTNARFIANRQVALSKRMFHAYMHAPYGFHLQRNSAELLRNVKGEVNEVLLFILVPGLALCMDVLMILFIFALLMAVEPFISVVALLVLGGTSMAFLTVIRRKVRFFGRRRHRLRTKLIQYVKQGLGGLKEARVLGREGYFIDAFVGTAREYAMATRYHRFITSLPARVIETIAVGGLLLVTLVLIVRDAEMSAFVPTVALFAVATLRLMPSFKHSVTAIASIKYHLPALDTVYEDLARLEAENAEESRRGRPHEAVTLRSAIDVREVSYQYGEASAPALHGITLSIPRGSAVAFVGTSGAGKTTLANLLLGLLQPTSGRILVDGQDIRNDLAAWRRNIGFIPQTPYLSDDSVRRNIAFGVRDDEIDERRVETVVEVSQLEALIASLPRGLDTAVGEEGVRLSGGQRQRIAIARALYHDPEVLVMDEATSALDNETELYIIQALERLRRSRTLIMIAHRLTTVRNCDMLHVLNGGRLVASGTYDDLLAHSSEFRTFAAA